VRKGARVGDGETAILKGAETGESVRERGAGEFSGRAEEVGEKIKKEKRQKRLQIVEVKDERLRSDRI
jgi:hypothetical protein